MTNNPNRTNPKFRNGLFGGLASSDEILEACEDVAGEEIAAVTAAAWSYAPADETELNWGQTTLTREG